MDRTDIKERILDVAEHLFAENGVKETSVRDITTAAGVHLAAVNYHFRSKEELVRAVIARRAAPLNRRRLELLEAYEAEAGDGPAPLERILHAFFAPSVQLCLQHADVMRLAARILFEADKDLRRIFLSHFVDVFLRFKSAVMRHMPPELPERELFWRMHFLIGAMIHTWANHSDLEWISGGLCTFANEQDMIERLIAFCAAGLRAPLPAHSEVTA